VLVGRAWYSLDRGRLMRDDIVGVLLAARRPDGKADDAAEAAWAVEFERRAREAFAQPDDDIAWETVRAELHAEPTG
jgi:hypothetical protein